MASKDTGVHKKKPLFFFKVLSSQSLQSNMYGIGFAHKGSVLIPFFKSTLMSKVIQLLVSFNLLKFLSLPMVNITGNLT